MKKISVLFLSFFIISMCAAGLMAAPAPVPTAAPTLAPTPSIDTGAPKAYPQPARNNVTFTYKLVNAATAVNIYIYNLMGSQIASFAAGPAVAGQNYYRVNDISKLAPGIYFYLIISNDAGGGTTKQQLSKLIVGR